MKLTKLSYLKKVITSLLVKYKVNVVLDRVEESRAYNRALVEIEKYLFRSYKTALDKDFISELMNLSTNPNASINTISNINVFNPERIGKADINQNIQFKIQNRLNEEGVSQNLIEIVIRLFRFTEMTAGQDAVDKLGVGLKYKMTNTEFIQDRVRNLFFGLNETTAKEITQKLEESIDNLLTVEETIDFLVEVSRERAKNRSKLIVDNETAVVSGETQFDVYQKSNVYELQWVTVRDERVCPICQPLDGKTITMRGDFLVNLQGGVKYPPAHINCRCFVIPVERGEGPIWTGKS